MAVGHLPFRVTFAVWVAANSDRSKVETVRLLGDRRNVLTGKFYGDFLACIFIFIGLMRRLSNNMSMG
jgi:hypothetical protein